VKKHSPGLKKLAASEVPVKKNPWFCKDFADSD
jgi:hypothetical protein